MVYAIGLTHEITRPWNGMHEWNGALYSLFARNLLRYPWEIHHGMPIIAVGDAAPAAHERSIYPNHPAGLAWLVAGAFLLLGESEWAARLAPIVASLGSVGLLMLLVRRRWGVEISIITGLVYSVCPMTVYFGRMVNHEPICLFLMLAAVAAWDKVMEPGSKSGARGRAIAVWIIAIALCVWVDWAGALFGGLFAVYVVWLTVRRRVPVTVCVLCLAGIVISTAGMLLHVVWGGFGGRVGDLAQVFFSRSSPKPIDWPETTWRYAAGNLTWPGLFLGTVGLLLVVRDYVVRLKMGPAPRLHGLGVLFATGVLWLVIFWRQFQMHNYWMFYLGPLSSLGIAWAILSIRDAVDKAARQPARVVLFVLLVVVAGFGFYGASAYYRYETLPPGNILAWREVRRMTSSDQRILVFPESTPVDQWGETRVRYINPPHFPYYADRLFDSEDDLDRVVERAADHAVYIVDLARVAGNMSGLKTLTGRFACKRLGSLAMFDLRTPLAPPTSAFSR